MQVKPMIIGIDARLWSETGVGRYIRNLVFQLAKVDTQNSYIIFLTQKNFEKVTFQNPHFQTRLADIPWHSLKEQLAFSQLLTRERLDLMHFPYFSLPLFYRGKFIVTIHDLIMHHFSTGRASTLPSWKYFLKSIAYKTIMQVASLRAEKIIAVSLATKQEIMTHLHIPAEKIEVTYEGVDARITEGEVLSKEKNAPYFLYVGNAYPHKNVDGLLRAFEEFKSTEKGKCQLILVGTNDNFYQKLQESLSDEQNEYIVFLHNVSDAALSSLYKQAKALIFVSLMEGFGLPALEALSLGKRVLVSDIPVMHEICGELGYYVDPNDPKAIAKMLQTLYTLPIDSSYEKKAIEWSKKFSWAKMAQETKNIYESCIGLRQS